MDVAIKIMLFQNTADPSHGLCGSSVIRAADRQRVLREAATCMSMSHPNVVATYHYEILQVGRSFPVQGTRAVGQLIPCPTRARAHAHTCNNMQKYAYT